MKKMKLPILLVSFFTLLTSCGEDSMTGKYGFQMGKESGTHFGLFVELSKEKYDDKTQKLPLDAKKTTLSFNIASNDSEGISDFLSGLEILIEDPIENPDTYDDGVLEINGYYYKGDRVEHDGSIEIKIGLELGYIAKAIHEIEPSITIPEFDADVVEKLIYTTYSGNSLTMKIPVSFTDVFFQLYWYGTDMDYNETDGIFFKESKYGKHDVGTHPTADDITKINETFEQDHEALKNFLEVRTEDLNLSTYRDYYTLGMGLLKQ